MKDHVHSLPVAATCLVVLLGYQRASAETCGRAATLTGEPSLVTAVATFLIDRGIVTQVDTCKGTRAHLERRDGLVVVDVDIPGADPIERVASTPETAATIVESWVDTDVTGPLLEAQFGGELESSTLADKPVVLVDQHSFVSLARGGQLFAAAETSTAADRTTWVGATLGACVKLGPICATARARFANVAMGPGPWNGQLDRHDVELLVGGDIPLMLHGLMFSPGIAAGVGTIHTHASTGGWAMGNETGGLRADSHATLSISISPRLAVDITLSLEITQVTEIEMTTLMQLPSVPRFFARLGAGVRYGAL